ncbi:MAG: hypothetical protein WEC37_05045 [Anaerolineales bacterium]
MLLLGVLSVLQLVVLPGLLLIRFFPGKRSFLQQSVYIFMLSLLANYVVIFALVAFQLYLRSVVLVLFAAEVAALLWLTRGSLSVKLGGFGQKIRATVIKGIQSFGVWLKSNFWSASLYFVFGLIALVSILWVLAIWIQNFDTVWQTYDAWASWDRWAEIWAQNFFPGDTWEYPQLLPMSYSLTYKFIGTTEVKFFAKSIMPLFSLVILLMFFDLGKHKRSFGYMLGAGLALYSINLFLSQYVADGYVDIPVACFSFMAVYTLLKARDTSILAELRGTLLLGSLATATAAVTKQPGLYLLVAYPILAYFWVLQGRKKLTSKDALAILGKHLGLVLLLVVPWYALMQYGIIYGGNTSNIQYVINDIYQGKTLPERFIAAIALLDHYVYFYIFLLLSLPVLNSRFRQIVIFLIFPYSILWAFFLSYEPRNLAIAFPLVALCVGIAVESWMGRLTRLSKTSSKLTVPVYAVVLVGLLALGAGTFVVNSEALIDQQIKEQRLIFQATLNEKLYRYFSRTNGPEKVITSYPIGWLPGLEDTWRLERFRDYDAYQATLNRYPDIELVLIPVVGVDSRILEEIYQFIQAGTYEQIFVDGNYMLVRIPPRN